MTPTMSTKEKVIVRIAVLLLVLFHVEDITSKGADTYEQKAHHLSNL